MAGGRKRKAASVESDLLRTAIRAERKLRITYRDSKGVASQRVVWPFALVYFEQSRVLSAWCELRGDFRNFSSDRIGDAELLEPRYPKRRHTLLAEWKQLVQASGRDILPETDIMPT